MITFLWLAELASNLDVPLPSSIFKEWCARCPQLVCGNTEKLVEKL